MNQAAAAPAPRGAAQGGPSRWLRVQLMQQLRRWHWISSALCLVGLLGFAATGVTLNHASQIEAEPKAVSRTGRLPPPVARALASAPQEGTAEVPARVAEWLRAAMDIDVRGRDADWTAAEAYVLLPRPGVDAWLSIDRGAGTVEHEAISRGVVAVLNDLHRGRNAGPVWKAFIDVLAVACLVFSLTGLGLLWLHAKARRITWPLVGVGLALPALLFLLFLHA